MNINIVFTNDLRERYLPRSERTLKRVLDVNDVEATNVLLAVHDDTSTAHVTTTSDHNDVSGIELHEIRDLALLKVEFDGVVDLDEGIGVTDGATVVGNDMGDTLATDSDLADLEKLVGSLLRRDTVDGETALHIVEETEVLARLLDRNDI